MRIDTHSACIVLLCVLLCLLSSCADNNPEPYAQSLNNHSNSLNMKGEPLQKTSRDDLARIQADLEYLGYDPGQTNGTYGPKTRQAIKRFQEEHGLHTDGTAGSLTEQAIIKALHARKTLQKNTPKTIQNREESNQ